MFLMSTSMVLCDNLIFLNRSAHRKHLYLHNSSRILVQLGCGRRRLGGLIPNAKKGHSRKRRWWKKFFFDEDGNWFGLKDEDMIAEEESEGSSDDEFSEGEKFEAWRRRAEAIVELREAREDMKNEENRRWEDWIIDETNSSSWVEDQNDGIGQSSDNFREDLAEMIPGRGLAKSFSNFVLGREDDDLLYEDRVFQYASFNSAKFLAILIIVPTASDFLVHDYVLLPFLDRLEFRDERRLENRRAFANIWSDILFGISLFLLLYFNQSKVALLKFTGYNIISNISDTGKAVMIILVTDIFLGYHSESGWQTLLEIIVEHYGIEVDQSAITIFVCLVPVIIDACVKLWMFKFLPRLSPKVANIFREMKRH